MLSGNVEETPGATSDYGLYYIQRIKINIDIKLDLLRSV
jgi:hypothetical protein